MFWQFLKLFVIYNSPFTLKYCKYANYDIFLRFSTGYQNATSSKITIVLCDQFSEIWSCIVTCIGESDEILKQLIASV